MSVVSSLTVEFDVAKCFLSPSFCFLKERLLSEPRFSFIRVCRRAEGLKAKMAQHKLSRHIGWMPLKCAAFETATFQFAVWQLHSRRGGGLNCARCVCHNVNPSRLGSSRYASLHGPGDPLGAPLWLCPLTHRLFLALSSHLKTPPGAIWLPFSVATWHLQGYGHALVWSNLHDGCQLPSACPD